MVLHFQVIRLAARAIITAKCPRTCYAAICLCTAFLTLFAPGSTRFPIRSAHEASTCRTPDVGASGLFNNVSIAAAIRPEGARRRCFCAHAQPPHAGFASRERFQTSPCECGWISLVDPGCCAPASPRLSPRKIAVRVWRA